MRCVEISLGHTNDPIVFFRKLDMHKLAGVFDLNRSSMSCSGQKTSKFRPGISYHDKLHKEESSNTHRTQSYLHSLGLRNKCYDLDGYIEYRSPKLKPLVV